MSLVCISFIASTINCAISGKFTEVFGSSIGIKVQGVLILEFGSGTGFEI